MTYPILQEGESLDQFYARIHDRGYVRVCTGCGTTRHASIVRCPCGNYEFVYQRTGQPPQVSVDQPAARDPDISAVQEQAQRVLHKAPEGPSEPSEPQQDSQDLQADKSPSEVNSEAPTASGGPRNPSLVAMEEWADTQEIVESMESESPSVDTRSAKRSTGSKRSRSRRSKK